MLVVADASVLINLCRIGSEGILAALFGEVWIPPAVAIEFAALSGRHPRFVGLGIPAWIRCSDAVGASIARIANLRLGAGESEAIALALEIHADAILLDDAEVRAAAVRLGLTVTGLAGILLRAKREGVVPLVQPLIVRLRDDANFWLHSDFENEVLRRAGEIP